MSWCCHHAFDKMRDLKTPTLPSVLAEYSPDFEITSKPVTGGIEEAEKAKKAKADKKQVTSSSVKQKNHHKAPIQRSFTPGSAKYSEKKQEERERQERVADIWDLARSEVQQERHEVLNQKIVLQQALIKNQEERSRELRRQEDEKKSKKRNDDLYSKHARESALETKCKQSIDQDRKAKQNKKADKDVSPDSGGNYVSSSPPGDVTSLSSSSPISPMGEQNQRMRKTGAGAHHGGYLPSSEYSPNLPQSPMRELEEDEEDDDDGGRTANGEVVTPADLSQLPWHHAQLYKMYGRNADYYIHPKMQPEQKKIVHPTLTTQKGHMDASRIWNTLRTDSKSKLYRYDRRFPQELKDAFSAHVREGINNQKNPVYRNFTVTDDVPDLKKLMDQSLLRHVAVLRHKTELMYRSSQTNNDRTKVLLFNSPLPAVNEGDEGIGKYLPSWNDDISDVSEPSYMRWMEEYKQKTLLWEPGNSLDDNLYEVERNLMDEEDTENMKPIQPITIDVIKQHQQQPPASAPPLSLKHSRHHPKSVLSPVPSTTSEGLQTVWHSVMARQKPRRQPKYHFLTEEEARVQGTFLENLGLEKDRIDQGRVDLLPLRDPTASRQSLPGSLKPMSAIESRCSLATGESGQRRSESAQTNSRFQSSWQPLSMHALIEYKDQMATQGKGEYQQGRPRMWPTQNKTALQQQ